MRPRIGMNELPTHFKKSGWTFEQITRQGNWAIYRKHKKACKATIESFELIKPVISKNIHNGQSWIACEPREVYPHSELWGVNGFSLQTLSDATYKLGSL